MSNKKILSPYLNLNRLKNPKDDFKNCIKVLKKKTTLSEKKIIDIGCANGELLFFLHQKFQMTLRLFDTLLLISF